MTRGRTFFIVKNDNTAYVITLCYVCLFFCFFFPDMQITTIETPYPVKEEEENAMHNTVVIFSSNDSFTLKQVFVYLILESVADVFHFESPSMNFYIHLDGLKLNLCLKTSPTG